MGGSFAVMLGGDALVGVVAFFVSLLIMGVNTWAAKVRVPHDPAGHGNGP